MSSRRARRARESLRLASQRRDIKWCPGCGAVRSGAGACGECSGSRRLAELGFSDLYGAYAGPLRRFVYRLADDQGLPESLVDTEGIVHDTFMVLLSGSREPVRNPGAWLFTVARNQVSKAAAAQRRTAFGDPADHVDGGRAAWTSFASRTVDAEELRAAREVMRAIAGLPGHQRIATYLRQVQGWSLAEIGAYLNCAASTAGVHISRGTTKVRSSLSTSADYDSHYDSSHHSGSGHHYDSDHWSTGSAHAGYSDRHGDYRALDGYGAQGPACRLPGPHGDQVSPEAPSGPRRFPPGRRPYPRMPGQPQSSLLRRRRARRGALAAAGILAGALLAAAGAHALGMTWWLAAVTAAVLVISVTALRFWWWWKYAKYDERRLERWLRRRAGAWSYERRHERRFNRWLRTGRPLGSPAARLAWRRRRP